MAMNPSEISSERLQELNKIEKKLLRGCGGYYKFGINCTGHQKKGSNILCDQCLDDWHQVLAERRGIECTRKEFADKLTEFKEELKLKEVHIEYNGTIALGYLYADIDEIIDNIFKEQK